jgi:hypothetical protein
MIGSSVLLTVLLTGCERTVYSARFTDPHRVAASGAALDEPRPSRSGQTASLDLEAPFLKCHFRDGRLVLMDSWQLDEASRTIKGVGLSYSAERRLTREGPVRVALDDVALIETNRPEAFTRTGLAVMAVVTGASLALTGLCMASPKTCFGSCPTFYGYDGERFSLMAEGFSSSVARSLESTDVDSLFGAQREGGRLRLWLTNEAPETHSLRSVRVLAAERPEGGRVYRAGEAYVEAGPPLAPDVCVGPFGDCLAQVRQPDEAEVLAPTDGADLRSQATIEVVFNQPPPGELGLVIGARNGLLGSFLFYQALADMGDRMGEVLAELERAEGGLAGALAQVDALLGELKVEQVNALGELEAVGSFAERGPIAREVQLVRLPAAEDAPLRLRLTGTRGHHKLDYVALVPLLGPAQVERLEVVRVEDEEGASPRALAQLRAPSQSLVTQAGDAYLLEFEKPTCERCEFFLEARGYYYEWARDVWFAERDDQALLEWVTSPEKQFVRLAPAYKAVEQDIERLFFGSRVRTRMRPPEVSR